MSGSQYALTLLLSLQRFVIRRAIGLVELFLDASVNLVAQGFAVSFHRFALARFFGAHRAVAFHRR